MYERMLDINRIIGNFSKTVLHLLYLQQYQDDTILQVCGTAFLFLLMKIIIEHPIFDNNL